MAARVSRGLVEDAPREREAVSVAISTARPSLAEILSVWPANQRDRLVIRIKVGDTGDVSIGAQLRDRENAAPELKRALRRIQDDVPVILALRDGTTEVVPLRLFAPNPR
jgi:hypothetical protein